MHDRCHKNDAHLQPMRRAGETEVYQIQQAFLLAHTYPAILVLAIHLTVTLTLTLHALHVLSARFPVHFAHTPVPSLHTLCTCARLIHTLSERSQALSVRASDSKSGRLCFCTLSTLRTLHSMSTLRYLLVVSLFVSLGLQYNAHWLDRLFDP